MDSSPFNLARPHQLLVPERENLQRSAPGRDGGDSAHLPLLRQTYLPEPISLLDKDQFVAGTETILVNVSEGGFVVKELEATPSPKQC